MHEIYPEECKNLQLNILVNIANFCEEHNIKYSLAYGTLIGAIRHKGFIPWDDDIDIIMMRDDYERFVATYQDEKYVLIPGEKLANHLHVVVSDMSTQLEFLNSPGDSFFYHGGVWVDIFPIDKVPNSKICYKFVEKSLLYIKNLHRFSQFTPRNEFYLKIFHQILAPFEGIFKICMLKMIQMFNKTRSATVADLALCYLSYPSFPAKLMDEFIDVEFEGFIFKSIKEYDFFLRGIYGDYMKLPPVDQRVPRHNYRAFLRE